MCPCEFTQSCSSAISGSIYNRVFSRTAPELWNSRRKRWAFLAVLVRNARRVVLKADLLDIAWPGTSVEEGNLAVHIFALRQALGENASNAEYIETIPKRCYRFAAPILRVREHSASPSSDQSRDL